MLHDLAVSCIALIMFLSAMLIALVPRCEPGDRFLYVGGVLMAGCTIQGHFGRQRRRPLKRRILALRHRAPACRWSRC